MVEVQSVNYADLLRDLELMRGRKLMRHLSSLRWANYSNLSRELKSMSG